MNKSVKSVSMHMLRRPTHDSEQLGHGPQWCIQGMHDRVAPELQK